MEKFSLNRLIIFFFSVFLSSVSFAAGWGDTFFCEMSHNEEKKAMVFGDGGFFDKQELPLRVGLGFINIDSWEADGDIVKAYYYKGLLLMATVSGMGILSIRATCDNFK